MSKERKNEENFALKKKCSAAKDRMKSFSWRRKSNFKKRLTEMLDALEENHKAIIVKARVEDSWSVLGYLASVAGGQEGKKRFDFLDDKDFGDISLETRMADSLRMLEYLMKMESITLKCGESKRVFDELKKNASKMTLEAKSQGIHELVGCFAEEVLIKQRDHFPSMDISSKRVPGKTTELDRIVGFASRP
jgi:hypothetical protein